MLTKQVVLWFIVTELCQCDCEPNPNNIPRRNKICQENGHMTCSQKENTGNVHLLFNVSIGTNSEGAEELYHIQKIYIVLKNFLKYTVRRHVISA